MLPEIASYLTPLATRPKQTRSKQFVFNGVFGYAMLQQPLSVINLRTHSPLLPPPQVIQSHKQTLACTPCWILCSKSTVCLSLSYNHKHPHSLALSLGALVSLSLCLSPSLSPYPSVFVPVGHIAPWSGRFYSLWDTG